MPYLIFKWTRFFFHSALGTLQNKFQILHPYCRLPTSNCDYVCATIYPKTVLRNPVVQLSGTSYSEQTLDALLQFTSIQWVLFFSKHFIWAIFHSKHSNYYNKWTLTKNEKLLGTAKIKCRNFFWHFILTISWNESCYSLHFSDTSWP